MIMNRQLPSGLNKDNTSFIEPEFLRVKDVERMFGIKRGKLNGLVDGGRNEN
jgi:hypothetical protein